MSLRKAYQAGTHRLISPEETLERIRPHLRGMGITRCADVTGLDCLGVPTYAAIRPTGLTLQVSNGKGLRPVDAKVSALMEALEYVVAEQQVVPSVRGSRRQLERGGQPVVSPSRLELYLGDEVCDDDRVTDWVEGDELLTGARVLLPACAAYFRDPVLNNATSNGLASGNHVLEATLHGLYELLERDTLSQAVTEDGVSFDAFDTVHTDGLPPMLAELSGRLDRGGVRLVLMRAQRELSVHTFLAVLLDPNPYGHCSTVNVGAGAHLSPLVAAIRAITEAAQSRLTFIHSAREDLSADAYAGGEHEARLMALFSSFEPDTPFSAFADGALDTFEEDYEAVLSDVRRAGFDAAYRAVLHAPHLPICVVKTLVPGAQCTFPL